MRIGQMLVCLAFASQAFAQPVKPAVKLLVAHQGFSTDGPIHIAQERGYFREQGLDVELMRFNSTGEQIAALGTGQLAVGVGGVNAALFNAVAGDVPIKIVADKFHARPDYTGLGFMIRSDLLESGKVKSPKDLKGLKIARGQRATANETELVLLLREGGLTLNDVITHDIPYSDIAPALANKSIDAAYAVPPFSHIVESRNFGKMWRASGTIVPNHQVAVILYSPHFAEKQQAAARGWMIAYVKGVRVRRAQHAAVGGLRQGDVVDVAPAAGEKALVLDARHRRADSRFQAATAGTCRASRRRSRRSCGPRPGPASADSSRTRPPRSTAGRSSSCRRTGSRRG